MTDIIKRLSGVIKPWKNAQTEKRILPEQEKSVIWLKERRPEWEGIAGIGACVSTVTEKGLPAKEKNVDMI